MAITFFTHSVWSETLYRELDQQYIGVAHCNRDFEGDIKNCGDTVKIIGITPISVFDYEKNADMTTPDPIRESMRELQITEAKYFNFLLDDIDRAQSNPNLMREAMRNAAASLAYEADCLVFQTCQEATNSISANAATDSIIDTIISARTKLFQNNVTDNSELYLEITPTIAEYLFKEKRELLFDNTSMVENGCIGSIHGCRVYVSNNVPTTYEDDGMTHHCVMRTKRAVTFAEQLSEIDAYRPELRFADAVKGLHLYGAKVIYPKEIVKLDFFVPNN